MCLPTDDFWSPHTGRALEPSSVGPFLVGPQLPLISVSSLQARSPLLMPPTQTATETGQPHPLCHSPALATSWAIPGKGYNHSVY